MKNIFRILIIPRRTLVAISVLLIITGMTLVIWNSTNLYSSKEVFATPLNGKTILIDPGHGGIDAGASEGNAVEKTINLEISKLLSEYIELGGGTAYLTRTTDTNTADPNRPKGVSQKMSDLKTRKQNITDYNADLFISIHMNKFQQSQYRGFQAFYDKNSAESKALAELLQKTVAETICDGNNRKAKPNGDSIYVLKGNTIPSVLVECGFLSNPEEARLLTSPDYQKKLAFSIYWGIMKYFNAEQTSN